MTARLGLSGAIARRFMESEITPLLALVGLLMGLFAVLVTPREEEPQIDVTFANVFVPFPGATAGEVERLVSGPMEQLLAEISGVEHVYSVSRPGMAALTVQFEVGEPRTEAIVRLYNQVYAHPERLPTAMGVGQPIVQPKGIDDVPILALTLWTEDTARGGFELSRVAHALEAELKRIPGTRDIYTLGAPQRIVEVALDPARLSGHGLAVDDLARALAAANRSLDAGSLVGGNREVTVQAGSFLATADDIDTLVVGLHNGAPVYLADVAEVRDTPAQPESYLWLGTGPAAAARGITQRGEFPAVTLAIAKQPGENAADIANAVGARLEALRGVLIPEGVEVTVTRDYGATADDKARTLIGKLGFATAFVVLLVLVALGWREALIVGAAVVVTLTVTLFASWAWGFTLNRVSLFALIFSIGILVDDAIVVVENIHRHVAAGGAALREAIPRAVDEVGGPTILATFTVIAALLPMAFVSGLMGPYMSPIPINASTGMLISLIVAFVLTPWLMFKVLSRRPAVYAGHAESGPAGGGRAAQSVLGPFLHPVRGARRRRWLGLGVVLAIAGSLALVTEQAVVLKMLPFDNKSEFQVIVDLPEGTPLEQTARVLGELGRHLATVEEVTDYQVHAGTAAPINFNGLVRQYYLRAEPHLGDIQVNLTARKQRERNSHDIARSVRAPLQAIGARYGANVKVVEVPPGPPVMAPLVAEVYGGDYSDQRALAEALREVFAETADLVDIDTSIEAPAARYLLRVDRAKAGLLGVTQQTVAEALAAALGGADATFVHADDVKYPVPVRLRLPDAARADIETVLSLKVRSATGALVPLSELVDVAETQREQAIYHKDLLPVVFVVADMAGALDSPLYGMFDVAARLREAPVGGVEDLPQSFIGAPEDPYAAALKWDGEWQITYETFRDMGIAYSVGLVLIYLLVVAQFRSYAVPLVIMAPIPLTIIGVMPGHALLGVPFTATSMIGMIALAGIIVRNSILLVDFINLQLERGMALDAAVISSAAVRAKPIALTALAAMLGALFILDDPIFSGLAVSLIFGILVSTLLTLVVIPLAYYALLRARAPVSVAAG